MSTDAPPVVYIETTVILALLKGEKGRADLCAAALTDAKEGATHAITSALTIAEVIKLNGEAGYLPESTHETIKRFFQHPWIYVVSVDRRVASQARRIAPQLSLKPPDAIHLATAQLYSAERFFTFDTHFLRLSGQVPPIDITEPSGQIRLGV